MSRAVLAVFRPARGDVAVIVDGGTVALDLDEARRIHATLGQALALADCHAKPTSAVAGCFEDEQDGGQAA